MIIGLGLGLIPGVDNFAHLGGFAVGLLLAFVLLPVIHTSKTHRVVFYTLRIVALPLVVLGFVLLIRNFGTDDFCPMAYLFYFYFFYF